MEDIDFLNNLCTRLEISIERVLDQPSTIFQDMDIISLDLSNMNLTYLPNAIFGSFKYLESLDLSKNNLIELSDKTFESCSSISKLSIQKNKSLDLQTDIFQCMKKLLDLNISLNDIKSLIMLSECNIPNLTILTLESNRSLPTKLFHKMKKLRTLTLICPRKLDNNIFVNLNLKYLRISKLNAISECLLDPLHNLVELHLNDNNFNSIPTNVFQNMQELKLLDLSDNLINFLDIEIFNNLIQLEELNLSNNKILTLQDRLFDNLHSLQILNLSGNPVDSIYYKNTNIYF